MAGNLLKKAGRFYVLFIVDTKYYTNDKYKTKSKN
mgnify:CR=1 FL=1